MTHNSGRNWINVDFLEFFELLGLYIYVYIFLPDGQAIIYIYTVRDMYLRIEIGLSLQEGAINKLFLSVRVGQSSLEEWQS